MGGSTSTTATATATTTAISTGSIGRYPLIYRPEYNISWYKLENLHPFDSKKYGKVYQKLLTEKIINSNNDYYKPEQCSIETLELIHTAEYLQSIKSSSNIARIIEVPLLAILPYSIIKSKVLIPMLYATGGTILAAELAIRQKLGLSLQITTGETNQLNNSNTDSNHNNNNNNNNTIDNDSKQSQSSSISKPNNHNWAINLGGGYHHACGSRGGGFCVFADISLAIININKSHPLITKFMIIDLDAHQGNGYANDKLNGRFNNLSVFILDMFNKNIYPFDYPAMKAVDCPIKLNSHTADKEYLELLETNLIQSLDQFKPQLVIYNAGTDCLINDPLGQLDITPAGIAQRDYIVFNECFNRSIPIAMVLSGGYQQSNAGVIADSIIGLNQKFGLFKSNTNNDPNNNIKSEL